MYSNDECSWTVSMSIDDIDECELLDYETNKRMEYNKIEAEPIV